MTRVGLVALLGLLWVALPGVQLAQAKPIVKEGTSITLAGADDAAATGDHYLRDVIIRLLGAVVSIGGLLGMKKDMGAGGTGAVAGVGIVFVPEIIGSGADKAASATSLAFMLQTPLAVWVQWAGQVLADALVVMTTLIGVRTWRRRHLER